MTKTAVSASNNDVGIIAGILLFCTTPYFEALTNNKEYSVRYSVYFMISSA